MTETTTTPVRKFGEPITDSTQIVLVEYDSAEKRLRVTFKRGAAYDFFEVETEIAEALLSADSVGKQFHRTVRAQRYRYKKVKKADGDKNDQASRL